jgi:hypothetical protein
MQEVRMDATTALPQPALQLLYRSWIGIAAAQEIGTLAAGRRRVIPITGGAFDGPRLRGRVLPGGADWQVLRNDGVAELEARYTLETHDGALIYIANWGLRHGPPEVMARLAAGEAVSPDRYYFRCAPRFECGHPDYAWLNGTVCVASGHREAQRVLVDVYALT